MLEKLTTYTEVDGSNRLTVSDSEILVTNLSRKETAYVYKDFGANFFDKLDIRFNFRITSADVNGVFCGPCLSNVVNAQLNLGTNAINTQIFRTSLDFRFTLEVMGVESQHITISLNTTYYCKIERDAGGSAVTASLYTDESMTTLHASVSCSCPTATKWRYFYGSNSRYDNIDRYISGYIRSVSIRRKNAAPMFWW